MLSSLQSIRGINFIIYVTDQQASTRFYSTVLDLAPTLNVPGMTEFSLPGGATLGLMPLAGIRRLLGDAIASNGWTANDLHCELYFTVDDANRFIQRAEKEGGRVLSEMKPRDWGDSAGYVLDPDGHVLAFAQAKDSSK